MPDYRPDSVDMRIIHALQVEPQASWAQIAPIVGADPATISRRWRRLREKGFAWVTGMMDTGLVGGALIEIECAPGDLHATAQALAADPEVITIDYTVGGRELLVTVLTQHAHEVSDYLLGSMTHLSSIRAAHTHLVTERIIDARRWRLRELNDAEVARIPRARAPRSRAATTISHELRKAIRKELAADGRTTAAAIAERHDFSPQRVTDAIATLRARGELVLRTDVARELSAWPVYTWYFLQVPPQTMVQARTTLARVPEIRLAALCSSRYNLILAVWLRTMKDVHGFEVALARVLPGAVIGDRSVVVRMAKHVGHVLDERGRATGPVVPLYRDDLA